MADFSALKTYILNELVTDADEVDDDTSLFSSRVVHSRNLLSLIQFIEDEYSIQVSPMDLTVENFDTINRMVAFLSTKL